MTVTALIVIGGYSGPRWTLIVAGAFTAGRARAAAATFLEANAEVPGDADDVEAHLVLTDGTRTWEADDLTAVTAAGATDPAWLQLRAAVNKALRGA
ncbi:hypothetical protein [Streptomyces sp. NPDC090112]|uniref:hypothetical protein n=1 Tax=Streptomyces sp. NPDC090112 TaxID=3365949 RepID=UPI0037F3C51C